MNKPYFPPFMTVLKSWVLWRLETRNEKPTKVPYQPNGSRASTTDPATWATHQEVINALKEQSGTYDGIGFVLSQDARLIFIDIDHCIQPDGSYDDRAIDILNAFSDDDGELITYAEISQSGTGIHLFVIGEIPRSFKNSKLNVEMYASDRYCAMTGNALSDCDPAECPHGIIYVFEKYKTAKKANNCDVERPRPDPATQKTDSWTIACALKHGGQKLYNLYVNGDISGYESHSEADLALCKLLAFWTNNDEEMIDRLFRQSALYRAKWERNDYASVTIRTAIATNDDTIDEFHRRKQREEGVALLESLMQSDY